MKSLDIVTTKLYQIDRMNNFLPVNDISIEKEELQLIKKDLEVLEILKKFLNEAPPDIEYWNWRQAYALGLCGEISISLEEKDKLKQWLEEKE